MICAYVKRVFSAAIVAVFIFGGFYASAVFAQTTAVKSALVTQEIEGDITWLGKDRIAIVYRSDAQLKNEEEILLPFDKNVKLSHVRSLSEIAAGDRVHITFVERFVETPNGQKLRREIVEISLVRKAAVKAVVPPATSTEEAVQ